MRGARGERVAVLGALGCLYTAQGIPFGFATEYLPVVLREQRFSYAAIAALFWLQLPWQLKIFWAKSADHPALRRRTRSIIVAMQLALTLIIAGFAIRPLREAPTLWFALTFVAAALAATQDVFVDAFAVRTLRPDERGFGNTAQVAGYRIGMLVGGAALLLFVGRWGERATLLGCAAIVAAASVGAFVGGREETGESDRHASASGSSVRALVRHVVAPEARGVLWVAMTFKLGLHMASSLLKPMAVDYGWSKERIGWAVVTVGAISAIVGAAAGGAVHRALTEKRALAVALVVQAMVCLPLVVVDRLHAPLGLTTACLAAEHFGSGLGTTVLFAALMTATRSADAGLHYTLLTSANAVAIGVGGLFGALVADHASKSTAFVAATVICFLPVIWLVRWRESAEASRT